MSSEFFQGQLNSQIIDNQQASTVFQESQQVKLVAVPPDVEGQQPRDGCQVLTIDPNDNFVFMFEPSGDGTRSVRLSASGDTPDTGDGPPPQQ
jgi:hypothetical protein